MENTSGFYKLDGELLYGPNFVLNKDYELRCELYTEYTYPVDGWSWFDSEEEARIFFNLPLTKQINERN
jgi:hypothetical protein